MVFVKLIPKNQELHIIFKNTWNLHKNETIRLCNQIPRWFPIILEQALLKPLPTCASGLFCMTNIIWQKKRHVTSKGHKKLWLLLLSDHELWRIPATMSQAALWRGPCGQEQRDLLQTSSKELRPPANSCVNDQLRSESSSPNQELDCYIMKNSEPEIPS